MKKLIAWLLTLTLVAGMLPAVALAAAPTEEYSIDNGFIIVNVSGDNGGFSISTAEGDRLRKSDDNKRLLFHNGAYDSSFLSFQVDYGGGRVEEYLFGGVYGGSSDPSRSGVRVTQAQENGDIVATWSTGSLTFTELITLANAEGNEHGMVSIQLGVQNSGPSVSVKSRLLLDTYLGSKDYGYYMATDANSLTHEISKEQILTNVSTLNLQNFYAMDDAADPSIYAYSVNASTQIPYQVAFGHWNSLASTLFTFTPDNTIDFTDPYNDYQTADSAYALYYDMGTVANGASAETVSFYGVHSRSKVTVDQSVAIDVTAPVRLFVNEDRSDFERLSNTGIADFAVEVAFENFEAEGASDLRNVKLAISSTGSLRALDEQGQAIENRDFGAISPLIIGYASMDVGEVIQRSLLFDAQYGDNASYERITIGVYNQNVTAENKLGEKILYVLLPGADGDIPDVSFASMTPEVVYKSGTRHLFVTVTNPTMLDNRADWSMRAYPVEGGQYIDIPHDMISISGSVMDVALDNDIKMATGTWYLQLEWVSPDRDPQKQTSQELHFIVTDDIKYKNDAYGVLCVVEYIENHKSSYEIRSFKTQSDFDEFRAHKGAYQDEKKYEEILLIFKGEFTQDKSTTLASGKHGTYYTAVSTKTVDANRKEAVDNCVTINDCMDFEGGTMNVYYEDYDSANFSVARSAVCIEFDGELLTSNARTDIWEGKAVLTKIEQGTSYSLLEYDSDGVRDEDFLDNTIKLVWPSVFGVAQTLIGAVFNFAYGELGVMMDDDVELGRVLSFSASLDLSFAMPSSSSGGDPDNAYWSQLLDYWADWDESTSPFDYDDEHGGFAFQEMEEESDNVSISGSVMVRDILFGCGKGFIGYSFAVKVGLKNIADSLPGLEGTLEIDTIENATVTFEGEMELPTFALKAKLSFKTYNGFPFPDELYFFVGNFTPGINVETCAIFWITGGGGGFKDLYDTLFLTEGLPPLKLILSIQLSIVQVLNATGTIAFGMTGIELEASDITIAKTIEAFESVGVSLEWYPSLHLSGTIKLNLMDIVKGNGYVVVEGKNYTEWFCEMFARASLSIPKIIPIFGGITIYGADFGMNADRLWGAVEVLGTTCGITYYWGDDRVKFGEGSKASPTYPSLLGCQDIPVGYDEATGKTLYACYGTNVLELVLLRKRGFFVIDGKLRLPRCATKGGMQRRRTPPLLCRRGKSRKARENRLGFDPRRLHRMLWRYPAHPVILCISGTHGLSLCGQNRTWQPRRPVKSRSTENAAPTHRELLKWS